ncbi:MAG: hypothetical protein HKM04_04515 [Legionellales bacterium]|nr:hypothetical protein [Legionellales bacterium]
MDNQTILSPTPSGLRAITLVMYGLMSLAVFFGITGIAAVIINYLKYQDTLNTLYESHFLWLRRTFWFAVLWGLIGLVTSYFLIGIPILIANAFWVLYRVIKGWLLLIDNKPIEAAVSSKRNFSIG